MAFPSLVPNEKAGSVQRPNDRIPRLEAESGIEPGKRLPDPNRIVGSSTC